MYHRCVFVSTTSSHSITKDELQAAHLNSNNMLSPAMHLGSTVSHDDPYKT